MQLQSSDVKNIIAKSGLIYIFSSAGVDKNSQTNWQKIAWASLSGVVVGAVNSNGVYLGTAASGVYRLPLNRVGESTHALVRVYGTDTLPTLLSNAIQGLSGAGGALLVCTSAGANYLPSLSISYAYINMESGCGPCAIGTDKIAYICGETVHVLSTPQTDWIAEDVVILAYQGLATPAMTSNTTPSGVASASSELNSSYTAYKAFDQVIAVDQANCWISNTGAAKVPSWLQYDFPSSKLVLAYRFRTRFGVEGTYTYSYPADFELQGWNGTTWDTLHSYTGLTGLGPNEDTDVFSVTSPGNYSKYRLYITAVTVAGGTGDFVCIGELELFFGDFLGVPNTINYGTDLFIGTPSGVGIYDGSITTEITSQLGTVLNVQTIYASGTATATTGLLAYGTSDDAAGGRFGILDLATSTNLVTESGDTLAVYASDDANSAIADDTLYQYGAVRNIVPSAGALGVPRTWSLYAEITDTVDGIEPDSVVLKINGVTVSPTITAITDGYRVDYSGTSGYNQPITATLSGTDGSGNTITRIWNWQTAQVTAQAVQAAPPNVICLRDLSLAAGEYDEMVDGVGVNWLSDIISPLIVTEDQAAAIGGITIDGSTYHRHVRTIDVSPVDSAGSDTGDLREGDVVTLTCSAIGMTAQKCEVLSKQRRLDPSADERYVLTIAYYEAV